MDSRDGSRGKLSGRARLAMKSRAIERAVVLSADADVEARARRGQLKVGGAALVGQIVALAVAEGGPAELEVAAPDGVAVTGRVVQQGKPVEGAVVELCAYPRRTQSTTPTPCGGQPYRHEAKTGADGGFRIEGVVGGHHGVAVRKHARWTVEPVITSCCGREGDEDAIGDIELTGTPGSAGL